MVIKIQERRLAGAGRPDPYASVQMVWPEVTASPGVI